MTLSGPEQCYLYDQHFLPSGAQWSEQRAGQRLSVKGQYLCLSNCHCQARSWVMEPDHHTPTFPEWTLHILLKLAWDPGEFVQWVLKHTLQQIPKIGMVIQRQKSWHLGDSTTERETATQTVGLSQLTSLIPSSRVYSEENDKTLHLTIGTIMGFQGLFRKLVPHHPSHPEKLGDPVAEWHTTNQR